MQSIVYHVAVSVDGFIAGLGGALEHFPVTGDHVTEYLASLSTYSSVVMGRKTYQVGLDLGVFDPYPHLDTYVCSRSLRRSPHPHVTLVPDDPLRLLGELRARPGKGVYLAGGGELAAQALAAGLVDELILKVNPLVLGDGIPLFARGAGAAALSLVSTKVHASGVVVTRYRVRG